MKGGREVERSPEKLKSGEREREKKKENENMSVREQGDTRTQCQGEREYVCA